MFNFFKKRKQQPKNFKEILSGFTILEEKIEKVSQELECLKQENKFSVKKIGIIRFNPFKEVGGDQSFCLALLDSDDTGVVITSLYNREGNRVYGKAIKNSQSLYELSQEEKQAIEKAKNHKQNYEKNSKFNNSSANSGGSGTH